MNIYTVTRKITDYDEYSGFVVVAMNPSHALELINKFLGSHNVGRGRSWPVEDLKDVKVSLVNAEIADVVSVSFRAG